MKLAINFSFYRSINAQTRLISRNTNNKMILMYRKKKKVSNRKKKKYMGHICNLDSPLYGLLLEHTKEIAKPSMY